MACKYSPLRVCVTGAASSIGQNILWLLSTGQVFGKLQPLVLLCLETPDRLDILKANGMELMDCLLPLLCEIVCTDQKDDAFRDIHAAFLCAQVPYRPGEMERRDYMKENAKIYKEHALYLNRYARPDVRVIVLARPRNVLALVCTMYAKKIPPENFTGLSRLDVNRARGLIARKLNIRVDLVTNVYVWGNHSSKKVPDWSFAAAKLGDDYVSVQKAVDDKDYFTGEFMDTLMNRGSQLTKLLKRTSSLSPAKAACDQMHDWWIGTPPGEYTSMAVYSDGSYGVPKYIFFAFPVAICKKQWSIVKTLPITDSVRRQMEICSKELIDEQFHIERVLYYEPTEGPNIPKRVCIVGAAEDTAAMLMLMIANGDVYGPDRRVILQCLEVPERLHVVQSFTLELQDCALPLLQDIVCTSSPAEAFNQADLVLILRSVETVASKRAMLTPSKVLQYKQFGLMLNRYARKCVRCLVIEEPCNTLTDICMGYAKSIPPENFTALCRVEVNRVISQIARQLKTLNGFVKNVIVWGDHAKEPLPDFRFALLDCNYSIQRLPNLILNSKELLDVDFGQRGSRRHHMMTSNGAGRPSLSIARAVCDQMHDWYFDTAGGRHVVMAVVSDGSYNIPPGIIYPFPVTTHKYAWSIQSDLNLDKNLAMEIKKSGKELVIEKYRAKRIIQREEKKTKKHHLSFKMGN